MWENVCFCSNICYHFAKDIAFLYHDISFVYITIHHLCISRLSRDLILWYIIITIIVASRLCTLQQPRQKSWIVYIKYSMEFLSNLTPRQVFPVSRNCLSSPCCTSYFFTYQSHRNIWKGQLLSQIFTSNGRKHWLVVSPYHNQGAGSNATQWYVFHMRCVVEDSILVQCKKS